MSDMESVTSSSLCLSSASSDAETQSINLSAGFDIVSLPDSPFEFLETDVETDKTDDLSVTMSQSAPHEATSSPANISEWVEQQSLPGVAPTALVTTMPSSTTTTTTLLETSGSPVVKTSADSTEAQTSTQKVYDITTLLQLSAATPMQHMELRIHPSALAGKLSSFSISYTLLVYHMLPFTSCAAKRS